MKKNVANIDIKDFNGDYSGYVGVIVAFDNYAKFENISDLFKYVEDGGNLIVAERPDNSGIFNSVSRKFGIYENGYTRMTKGLKLLTNIIIKGKGFERTEGSVTDSIPVQLNKECKVECVSDDNTPLIWKTSYEKGKILFVNGQFLVERQNRGLFAGLLGQIGNGFIYPIMNLRLEFIDDFPAPAPAGYNENIYREFGKSTANFYKDVWWPDMLRIAKKYGLYYTAYFVENYNNMVEGNFEVEDARNSADRTDLMVYGREILKSGGELGLHGYNHQPLAFKGFIKDDEVYVSWPNIDNMANSIREAESYFKGIFSNYSLRSYVPPSNIISPNGITAIKAAMPDLKTLCSVYDGETDGDAYIQEFERTSDGLLNVPRMSSGNKMTEYNRWITLNGITTFGVSTHFVHPDDVTDSRRNYGVGWRELSEYYEDRAKEMKDNFGWLRAMTVSDGAAEIDKYLNTDTLFKYEENGVKGYCNNYKGKVYFIFRSDKKIVEAIGCSYSKIDDDSYLVGADKCEFQIRTGDN
jgi:hypothetical protein